MNSGNLSIAARKQAALFGLYVADAVAMPVHWHFRTTEDIHRDYGRITGYLKPEKFKNSTSKHFGLKAGENTLEA